MRVRVIVEVKPSDQDATKLASCLHHPQILALILQKAPETFVYHAIHPSGATRVLNLAANFLLDVDIKNLPWLRTSTIARDPVSRTHFAIRETRKQL